MPALKKSFCDEDLMRTDHLGKVDEKAIFLNQLNIFKVYNKLNE